MKSALVTGGAGFIGSALAKRLLNEGWRVFIIDNLSTGFLDNIDKRAEFIPLDISKDNFPEFLPREPFEAVFHLAAQSSGEISFDDPIYDLKTNSQGTVTLMEWCMTKGIRRFIYTSSMSVYGEQEIQPVSENARAVPKSFYGVGKLSSEHYLNIYSAKGLQCTSLRLFNVYGPGQNLQNMRQGMVSIYMAYIIKNEQVIVKGSPERFRDFIYIDDVINAYCTCVNNNRSLGKTYNVGSGNKTYVSDLINEMLIAFGNNPSSYPIEYFAGSTPGDTFGIYADIHAIKNDLGWEPKVSLKDGLSKMAKWAISA